MGEDADARIAKTEALFREVNERWPSAPRSSPPTRPSSSASAPTRPAPIASPPPLDEYEQVRAEGDHFLVAEGHEERPDVERVVIAREGRYNVVRKLRELGVLVRRLNPRAEPAQ